MLTLHPAWILTLIGISQYTTQLRISKIPTKKPLMNSITLNPALHIFSTFFSTHSLPNHNDSPSTSSHNSNVTPTYSPFTSKRSNNSSPDDTQILHELSNLITLQQQLQHPQTLTIHQLSSSITTSNPSTPTPSSNYTPSLTQSSTSNQSSSSTTRAYRTFKRKFPNRPDVKGREKRITGKLKNCLNCQLLTQREEKLNSLHVEKQTENLTHCFVLTVIVIIKFDKRAKR